MVTQKKIAIIPARSGSKRILDKNNKLFRGKPMVAWTIETALESKRFDRIFVSTDNPITVDIAKNYGLETPFLRDKYADDLSPVVDATTYALLQIKSMLQEEYDIVVQLMPNCPLKTSQTIKNCLDHFISKDYTSMISCFKFGWNNPWWAFMFDENNQATHLFPTALTKRSQDLAELFCPTGAIWIAKITALLKHNTFYTPEHRFFPIPWKEAIDIDTPEDWEIAEKLFTHP